MVRMIDLLMFQRFLIALALGALIGLEREYATYKNRGHEYAGIRTFPLIALFGALCAYFGDIISPYILIMGMLIIGILVIVAYFIISEKSKNHFGATSEIAGLLTFFIGVLSYYQEFFFAVTLAVSIAVILYARSLLHHFAEKITSKELAGTLTFIVIVFLVLPLLPNQSYGPYGIFNPYFLWLVVVVVSGIGFIGYILMKWFGEKGVVLSGILGGMISSTFTTVSLAQRSMKEKIIYRALALGVVLANGIMFIRMFIEIFIINPTMAPKLIPFFLIMIAASAFMGIFLWQKASKARGKVALSSPLALWPALRFAIIFSVVVALVKLGNIYLSSQGIYLVSFLSGLIDVDAITLSLANQAKEGLDVDIASKGIMIAAITNVFAKGVIAYWMGGKKFSRTILWSFGFLIVVGLLLIWLM